MWSTVLLFVLTFAILGLLLGFAEIYSPPENDTNNFGNPPESVVLDGNVTSSVGDEDGVDSIDD